MGLPVARTFRGAKRGAIDFPYSVISRDPSRTNQTLLLREMAPTPGYLAISSLVVGQSRMFRTSLPIDSSGLGTDIIQRLTDENC